MDRGYTPPPSPLKYLFYWSLPLPFRSKTSLLETNPGANWKGTHIWYELQLSESSPPSIIDDVNSFKLIDFRIVVVGLWLAEQCELIELEEFNNIFGLKLFFSLYCIKLVVCRFVKLEHSRFIEIGDGSEVDDWRSIDLEDWGCIEIVGCWFVKLDECFMPQHFVRTAEPALRCLSLKYKG